MIAKKKKLSRKEIKEDKLITSYYKVREFIEQNSRTITIYAGVVIAVAAIVFFYLNNRRQNNEAASLQLAKILPVYDSGAYLEAIEGQQGKVTGLKKIVEEYGSTANGENAKIFLANAYSYLGKKEDAYKYYEDYSGSIDLYKASSLAGQAAYFADKKEYDKAAGLFEKASKVSKVNAENADYLLKASINYILAGKKDEAKESLKTISKEYQTSPAFREVEKYMALADQ